MRLEIIQSNRCVFYPDQRKGNRSRQRRWEQARVLEVKWIGTELIVRSVLIA